MLTIESIPMFEVVGPDSEKWDGAQEAVKTVLSTTRRR